MLSSYTVAASTAINVYLKLKTHSQVTVLIKEFNQLLVTNGLTKRYQLQPFANQHPLHITLYLATYPDANIAEIIKQTQNLAQHEKTIRANARQFSTNAQNYVMLRVENNSQLQLLSNKATYAFSGLRDNNAAIPAWAANSPERVALFKTFGSPNVLDYFNPHFSIMEPEHLTKDQITALNQQLAILITDFNAQHAKPISVIAEGIGVGVTDTQGQIVKELAVFPLAH